MKSSLVRTAALLIAMIAGTCLPGAHVFAWSIRWLIMAMLFVVFLQTRPDFGALRPGHLVLLAANLAIGFAAWGAGNLIGGHELGLAAFFTGITPTAAAAPVIIAFLDRRVDYVVASFLLTNIVIALLVPVMLPLALGHSMPVSAGPVLRTVALLVFVPLFSAWTVRYLHPPAARWPARLRDVSFATWISTIFLITSNASAFIRRQSDLPLGLVAAIGFASLLICAINFALGHFIGGREFDREASQSLGQKNTSFTVYLALTYANPLIALGPTFYVLWHNLWNSWQLHRAGRTRPPPAAR